MVFARKKRVARPSSKVSRTQPCSDVANSSSTTPIHVIDEDPNEIDASFEYPDAYQRDDAASSCSISDEILVDVDRIDGPSNNIECIDLVGSQCSSDGIQLLVLFRKRQNSSYIMGKWGAYAALRVISNNLHQLRPDLSQDVDETIAESITLEWEETLAENELVFIELRNRIDVDQSRRQEKLRRSPILEERDDGELPEASEAPSTPYSCRATVSSSSSLRWSEIDEEDDSLPDVSDLLPSWSRPDDVNREKCWLDDGETTGANPSPPRPIPDSKEKSTSPVRWADIEEDDSLPDVSDLLPVCVTKTPVTEDLEEVEAGIDEEEGPEEHATSSYDEDDAPFELDEDIYSVQLETASLADSETSSFSPLASPISEISELRFSPELPVDKRLSISLTSRSLSPLIGTSSEEDSPIRTTSKSQRIHRVFASLAGYLSTST